MEKLVLNSMGPGSDLVVVQDKTMFSYSIDTVLLGNFATVSQHVTNCLEIGAGNAALAIFLASRSTKIKIDAVEIQPRAAKLAQKNVALNNLIPQINVINEDFNDFWVREKKHNKKYDLIVTNPPFYKENTGFKRNGSNELHIATHEIKITLEQIIAGAAALIKYRGYLTIVEPTERLVDMFELMRKYHFEPKRVQMIFPREDSKSNLVLVEARYRSNWGTKFLPNIYLHENDKTKNGHQYRPNILRLYKPLQAKEKETWENVANK